MNMQRSIRYYKDYGMWLFFTKSLAKIFNISFFNDYLAIKENEILLDLCHSNNIHPDDFILDYAVKIVGVKRGVEAYLEGGKSHASWFKSVCDKANLSHQGIKVSLLEFASGYGRVTRHFDKDYYDVTACDIHEEATNFISGHLNVKTILSVSNPDDFNINKTFDIVFALSFFSHIPDRTFGKWLKVLYGCVNQGGALIFTTHGRISNEDAKMTLVDGYAFSSSSEQKDLDTAEYGITITENSYVTKVCEQFLSVTPTDWIEGGCDKQDLYIIKKAIQ